MQNMTHLTTTFSIYLLFQYFSEKDYFFCNIKTHNVVRVSQFFVRDSCGYVSWPGMM